MMEVDRTSHSTTPPALSPDASLIRLLLHGVMVLNFKSIRTYFPSSRVRFVNNAEGTCQVRICMIKNHAAFLQMQWGQSFARFPHPVGTAPKGKRECKRAAAMRAQVGGPPRT
jgi:hypothetical protein